MGKSTKKNEVVSFVFRQADSIGAADAAEDQYLADCFIETGAFRALKDLADPKRLLLGRTGSGKTAIFSYLEKNSEEKVIEVKAESLSLAHLSNSTILRFLRSIDVKLDLFFRFLWRHVLTVEILKRALGVETGVRRNPVDRLRDRFRGEKTKKAIDYLVRWGGERFWEETDVRIKEITTKFEKDIKASLTGDLSAKLFKGGIGGSVNSNFSQEEKREIQERAQTVVNQVQMRELSEVIDLVSDVLEKENKSYYILVDRLDENWVDDGVRYHLIRALIDTSRDFQRVRDCKIIIALRQDLLEHVLEVTRGAGGQEEKILSNILEIKWNRELLVDLLDKRVNALIKRRYTNGNVKFCDVMVRVDRLDATSYILDRTLNRPRDAINFLNLCIAKSEGDPRISARAIKRAEEQYSRERLTALLEEWHTNFPTLGEWVRVLHGQYAQFSVPELSREKFDAILLRIVESQGEDNLSLDERMLYRNNIKHDEFVSRMLVNFYKVGIVGLKLDAGESVQWVTLGGRRVEPEEIREDTRVHVHKMVWRALKVNEQQRTASVSG